MTANRAGSGGGLGVVAAWSVALVALALAGLWQRRGVDRLEQRVAAFADAATRERRDAEQERREIERRAADERAVILADLDLEQRRLHGGRLRAAAAALDAGTMDEMRALLSATTSDRRGFVWRHLSARLSAARSALEMHDSAVTAVAMSRDGRLAASLDADGLLVAWSVPERTDLTFEDGVEATCLAMSADGEVLALGDELGQVSIRTTRDLRERAVIEVHDGPVHALCFAPTADIVVSAGDDRTARRVATDPPRVLETFGPIEAAMYAVACDARGDLVFSAGDDGRARAWRAGVGLEREIELEDDWFVDLRCDDAGKTLAWRTDLGRGGWIDLASGARRRLVRGPRELTAIAVASRGDRVYAGYGDGEVVAIDPWRDAELWRLHDSSAPVDTLAVAEADRTVLTAAAGDGLSVWERSSNLAVRRVALPGVASRCIARDRELDRVAVGAADGRVLLLNGDLDAAPSEVRVSRELVLTLAFGGDALFAGCGDGGIHRIEPRSGRVEASWQPRETPVERVALGSDGALYVVYRDGGRARLEHAGDGPVTEWPAPSFAVLAVDVGGDRIAWSAAGGNARVWDAITGSRVAGFRIDDLGAISALALEPRLLRVAIARRGGDVASWDGARGASLALLPGVGGRVTDLKFLGRPDHLAGVDSTGAILVWDAVAGEVLLRVDSTIDEPRAIDCDPDAHELWVAGVGGVECLVAEVPEP